METQAVREAAGLCADQLCESRADSWPEEVGIVVARKDGNSVRWIGGEEAFEGAEDGRMSGRNCREFDYGLRLREAELDAFRAHALQMLAFPRRCLDEV